MPAAAVDLLFLEAERYEYPGFWRHLQRVLVPNGLTLDNAVSHEAEVAPFVTLFNGTAGYLTSLVPVGKGQVLILWHMKSRRLGSDAIISRLGSFVIALPCHAP